MTTLVFDPSGINLLIVAAQNDAAQNANHVLQIPTRENRKRRADEMDNFQAAALLTQLVDPSQSLEDQYRQQILAPFCTRITDLLTSVEGFEKRFFSPTPPNSKNSVYINLLEEGMWEYDLILDWLDEGLEEGIKKFQSEPSAVYSFLEENSKLIREGVARLAEKYDPLHTKLADFLDKFQTSLKKLKHRIETSFSKLQENKVTVDELISRWKGFFDGFSYGREYFQRQSSILKADLRVIQDQLLFLGNVRNIAFSSTHPMIFPYLAEERYFYLDPSSGENPDVEKSYSILQHFFQDYQNSVMRTHNNHFQALLGRTIEMRNICRDVFSILDALEMDMRKFSARLSEKQ